MKKITKEIFRSLNWHNDGLVNFSHRPTPYNISKYDNLPLSSVYREWKILVASGVLKKVIFLPADSLVRRHTIIFSTGDKEDFYNFTSKLNKIYFVEMIRLGRIYRATGEFENLEKSPWAIIAELVGSSNILAKKQTLLVSQLLEFNLPVIDVSQETSRLDQPINLERLAREISYSDIYSIRVDELSEQLNLSPRTVRRHIDRLLKERILLTFPLINQSVIRGFQTAVAFGITKREISTQSFPKLLKDSPGISEEYLLYKMYGGMNTVLLYYETMDELDQIVEELSKIFDSFALLIRYETIFNESMISSFKDLGL